MLFDWEKAIRADPQRAARALWRSDIQETKRVLAGIMSDADLPPEMRHRATTLTQHTDLLIASLNDRDFFKKFDRQMLLDTMTATRVLHADVIEWAQYVLDTMTASAGTLAPEERSALYESWRLETFRRNIESPED